MTTPARSGPQTVHELWLTLDSGARAKFAKTARSTENYIRNAIVYGRKWPKVPTVERIAVACNEAGMDISPEDLLVWFYRRRHAAMIRRRPRRVVVSRA